MAASNSGVSKHVGSHEAASAFSVVSPAGGGVGAGAASVAVILYVSIVLPSAAVQTVSMSSGVPATMGSASDGLPVATSFPSTLHFVDATLTVGVTYTSADFVHSRNVQVTENSK